MGQQQIHTDVRQLKATQVPPKWPYLESSENDTKYKAEQKHNYDKCHKIRSLPDKTPVWATTDNRNVPGRVVRQANTRSYYTVLSTHNTIKFTETGVNFVCVCKTLKQ